MKKLLMIATAAALIAVSGSPGLASERYRERPPVVVSPDLSAPWVLQLGNRPGKLFARQRKVTEREARRRIERLMGADPVRTAAVRPQTRREVIRQTQREVRPQMDPMFLPQEVDYDGPHKPGTIVIDTVQNFLFLVEEGGKARRYGVGTGKPGFEWAGTHKVTRKAEWPTWTPPEVMKVRERDKRPHPAGFHAGRAGKPDGRTRALYRLDRVPHPRHQPAVDDRRGGVVGLYPPAQRGRGRPLRTRRCRRDGRGDVGDSF